VNERGAAKTILTNSFTELYGQMLKMLMQGTLIYSANAFRTVSSSRSGLEGQ